MTELETRFRQSGRSCGEFCVRMKPAFEYVLYFLMITYQCYDCVSDGMNVHDYYEGNSLDVSSRDEGAYRAFFFSLVVSCLCALTSVIGYVLLVIGLSKKVYKHQENQNNTYKLGRVIVFFTLVFQVCFEESIQSVVMYYYIVRCSVIFSFWKTSLFVCTTLSLVISGHTFFKGAYLWFKRQNDIPRKYPTCLAPCYNLKVSHIGCVFVCLFVCMLTLGLFVVNIITLTDIIKYSENDVPHVFAQNRFSNHGTIKITNVKNLVKMHGQNIAEVRPCVNPGPGQQSNFLGEHQSFNCTTAVFNLFFAKRTKKLHYNLNYCHKTNADCVVVKATNITLQFSHHLCSPFAPIFEYVGDPQKVVNTKVPAITKHSTSNSSVS